MYWRVLLHCQKHCFCLPAPLVYWRVHCLKDCVLLTHWWWAAWENVQPLPIRVERNNMFLGIPGRDCPKKTPLSKSTWGKAWVSDWLTGPVADCLLNIEREEGGLAWQRARTIGQIIVIHRIYYWESRFPWCLSWDNNTNTIVKSTTIMETNNPNPDPPQDRGWFSFQPSIKIFLLN